MRFEFFITNNNISQLASIFQQEQYSQTTKVLWKFFLNVPVRPKSYFPRRGTEQNLLLYDQVPTTSVVSNEGNAHIAVQPAMKT